MLSSAIILALVAASYGFPPQLPQLDERIVGGSTVEIDQYMYQASLLHFNDPVCGGTIISPSCILTSAKCVDGKWTIFLDVRVGSSNRNSGGDVIGVKSVKIHPNYNSKGVDYDVAVVILKRNIRLGSPIPLANKANPAPEGAEAVVSGWGSTFENGPPSNQLQAATISILSPDVCKKAYGDAIISQRMMCAGVAEGGKDACEGDDGGPLVSNGAVVGITSWGLGCARPGYPHVYTNVASVRDFIDGQCSTKH